MNTDIAAKARELQRLIDAADETGRATTIMFNNRRMYRVEVTPLTDAEQAKETINESI
tara:strand:+ start:66259 stop:66432 length:174 start_codon:yes stop_codon:yes gene_type:complete